MRVKIKNIGVLRQAEFTLGEMTILCGENNTGKTYATYALFGFLDQLATSSNISSDDILNNEELETLLNQGVYQIDLHNYLEKVPFILKKMCQLYTKNLAKVFAAPEERFSNSEFLVDIDIQSIQLPNNYVKRVSIGSNEFLSVEKKDHSLIITLLAEKQHMEEIPDHIREFIVREVIEEVLEEIIFSSSSFLSHVFIASAERTGAAIFRKELNFARNRLLQKMSQYKDINPRDLLSEAYQDYALPVNKNVDFTRNLESIAKHNSFITEKYSEILQDFSDIIGGKYIVTNRDELYFSPTGGKRVKLTMGESSSAVRSLLDIGFYLKHVAQEGDLLIVDEPELNLHPENQRRIARLFARLVNIGIKVFITTHSDYIIKELNTLILLKESDPRLKQIREKEGYQTSELLQASQIKMYIAEEALVKLDDAQRKVRCQTLTPAVITDESGIEARSFDKTIDTMNRIQDEILWG
ncbi:MAG: ATP-binding protein [Thiotrichaceae bacterium]|nr:ATP-binding protein [Thiotrichaceae bacterium]